MKNMFIPHELAEIAYSKGFKMNCYGIGWYYKSRYRNKIEGLDTFYIDTNQNIQQWQSLENPIEAILYTQLSDWLRNSHDILIELYGNHSGYGYILTKKNGTTIKEITDDIFFSDYYLAYDKAITEALNMVSASVGNGA